MKSSGSLLFFVSEDWYFAMHFLQFAIAAKNEGRKVYLVCNTGQKGPEILSQILAAGIEVEAVPMARTAIRPFQDLSAFLRIFSLVRRIKPELIHAVALKPILISQCVSFFLKIPLLAMITGLGYVFISQTFKARFTRPIVVAALKSVGKNSLARLMVLNPEDADWAHKKFAAPPEKIEVIPGTGVDLKKFVPGPSPEGHFSLAYVGRMLVDKGIYELIEAKRILKKRGIQFRLLLVGAPDASNPASIAPKQLQQWQKEGLCECLGHISDVPGLMQKIHAVALPSYREGLGMSLLEAAATGLPTIATDVAGCRSAVIDGKTGLLVPAKDPAALADAISRLIADPELCKKMGKNGRLFVEERFASEIAISQMLEVYREMALES